MEARPCDTPGHDDAQVDPGAHTFTVPVPLSQIGDIGGVLYVGSHTYGCSIAPQG